MKTSVLAVIAGALAAAVNGVPIIDNANKAVTQAIQAHAASGVAVAHDLVHGVGPHRFDHIHGPPVAKMPGYKKPSVIDIIRPSISFQDAHTQTEMPVHTLNPTTTHIPKIIFTNGTEAVPSTFQTAFTLTQSLEMKTCIIRYNPYSSASFNDCPGQNSEDIRMKRTQMPGMPTQSISMSTPATNTAQSTSTRVGNVEWVEWYLLCSGDFFGWVPTQCATMTPYAPTGPEPSLMLTTDSTAMTAINKKTSSTEAEPTLMLTTDSTVMTTIKKKTSSTEAEPTLMLTTLASMITPTPTKEEATPITSTSTITETEDPMIEYTFAKVAKSPIVTRLG
ncbi:hypothetical protein CDEST_03884 [Colletotrichum destructivum]|uniref:Uncharacterized protein n=1 Tax=Colletotrichum destructivum TaxID=34406 RepID=A0AAX4I7C1_9PEZI|nr:hypothetical protein CDEST_03884 [Colletotrichum destructivum]